MTVSFKIPKSSKAIHQELFDRYGMPAKFSKEELLQIANSFKETTKVTTTEEKMNTIRYQPSKDRWKRSNKQK